MIDLTEAEKVANAGTKEFMSYARAHWSEIVEELTNLRSEVETLRASPGSFSFIPTFYGRILHSEISPEFGATVGKVECPNCQEEMSIGVMGEPPKCSCGLVWSLETVATGTPKITTEDQRNEGERDILAEHGLKKCGRCGSQIQVMGPGQYRCLNCQP